MGITFGLLKDRGDLESSNIWVIFNDNIREFLSLNKNVFTENIDMLTNLDPYDNKYYYSEEVLELFRICVGLIKDLSDKDLRHLILDFRNKYGLYEHEFDMNDILEFAISLKMICELTIFNKHKILVAIGD
ncbi:hypothetical protein [Aeribacillus pallidus]|uniref:hypothetical protein n=1 Tax=Aeribacillus pallidus TaxID=33936 RepID=UPI003D1D8C3D